MRLAGNGALAVTHRLENENDIVVLYAGNDLLSLQIEIFFNKLGLCSLVIFCFSIFRIIRPLVAVVNF